MDLKQTEDLIDAVFVEMFSAGPLDSPKKKIFGKNQLRVSGKMTDFVTDAAVVGTRQRTTDRIQIDRIIIISRIQTDRTVPKF